MADLSGLQALFSTTAQAQAHINQSNQYFNNHPNLYVPTKSTPTAMQKLMPMIPVVLGVLSFVAKASPHIAGNIADDVADALGFVRFILVLLVIFAVCFLVGRAMFKAIAPPRPVARWNLEHYDKAHPVRNYQPSIAIRPRPGLRPTSNVEPAWKLTGHESSVAVSEAEEIGLAPNKSITVSMDEAGKITSINTEVLLRILKKHEINDTNHNDNDDTIIDTIDHTNNDKNGDTGIEAIDDINNDNDDTNTDNNNDTNNDDNQPLSTLSPPPCRRRSKRTQAIKND